MWELTGSYMIMPRFGKATLKVQERKPSWSDSPGSWKNRFFFFRADDSYHYVTQIEQGSRWVLSFGKVIKNHKYNKK